MYAGQHATTAVNNVLVGFQAGNGLTTGNNATIVGYQAGQGLTTAGGNAAFFGYQAGQNVTGSSDTAVGYNALLGSVGTPSTGNFNTAVGTSALTVIEGAAQNNTVVGGDAASALTSGSFNTIMGHSAGNKITTGSQNVIIGEKVASTTLQTGSGNILIGVGNNIDTPVAGTTNTLNIGGVITATAIGTPSSSVMTMPGNVIVSGTLKNLWAAASNTVSFAAGGTGTINDNSGAGGSINANLVAAAAGLHACFAVATAQPLVVNANGTDVIYLGASPTVAGGNLSSSTVGSTVCLAAVEAGVWYALSHEGTWAVN
jgi:hypothetical protein